METQTINEIKAEILALQAKLDQIIKSNTVYAEHDFDMAIHDYADHLVRDYNSTGSTGGYSISYVKGRKFLKVVYTSWNSPAVHSFICVKAHDNFKFGDILKAASWTQAAKNFARGNVLDPSSYQNHRWTGA